jgi:hypothetical protein
VALGLPLSRMTEWELPGPFGARAFSNSIF